MDASIKKDMRAFYAAEAGDRDDEAWLRLGGSARVPESPASHYFIDRKVNTAIALAAPAPGARVLEVGCSFGHMTFLLTERFREVVGVDLSEESIDLAQRRAAHYRVANVEFQVGDAERLERFGDASFDTVFSFSTLRFCPRPEAALAEMFRVTRPGGRVVVDVPNRYCPWYGPFKRMLGIEPHIHDRLFSAGEIETLMRASGLAAVRSRSILFTTKRVPTAALPAFKLLDRVVEPLPGLNRLSGIVMAGGTKPGAA